MNEPIPPPNPSFSSINPYLQLAWDSTSYNAFCLCPRYYFYNIIMGYTLVGEMSADLKFGILLHSSMELYDRFRADGYSHEDALTSTFKFAVNSTWDDELKRPWVSDEPTKTRNTLLRTIVWYLDKYKDENLKTHILPDGRPAVELPFRFSLDNLILDGFKSPNDEEYQLCGYLDKVVSWNDELWIRDIKAQPTTSKVLSPNGWVEIKDLKVGDLIASQNGTFKPVKSLTPKGVTKVYRFIFADGSSCLCGEDHLWQIANDGQDNWNIYDTKKIIERLNKGRRYHIPLVKPIQHPEINLQLDPYILGALLGDGYFGGNSVAITTSNELLAEKIKDRLPTGDNLKKSPANNLVWTITSDNRNCTTLRALKHLGLWGHRSREKFIPREYFFASEQQRRDLLQGLLDTDGSWDGFKRRFQSSSIQLANGVRDLIRSLGGWASIVRLNQSNPNARHPYIYRVNVRMPDTPLGAKRRYIKEIIRVEDAETVCIEIDCWYNHLYITDDYIVTHNTTKFELDEIYFRQYTPNHQISLYSIAGSVVLHQNVDGVIIDGVQILVNGSKFLRKQIPRSPSTLEDWLHDFYLRIKEAEFYAAQKSYPMNPRSCGWGKRKCQYWSVCSSEPEARFDILENYYSRRTWNPLEPR